MKEIKKKYYEAHITMLGTPDYIRPRIEELGWRFSAIDGDPVLGAGVKCYATRMFNERLGYNGVILALLETANILDNGVIKIIRRKVELVIYDDRDAEALDSCKGDCPECHAELLEP